MTGARLLEATVLLAIVLLVAGLTHLVAVLLLPSVATHDAYNLLSERYLKSGSANRMILLPDPGSAPTLVPFRDPATVQGVCFFDLTKSPVRIKTRTTGGRFLALSLRSPDGRIFYSLTDRAALRETIDIRLLTRAQLEEVAARDTGDDDLPEELRLVAPSRNGLVVVTALVARPSERQDAEARVEAVSCAPEPIPAAS